MDLTPQQFEIDKHDIFRTLKEIGYDDIMQRGHRTKDEILLSIYTMYLMEGAYFLIDQRDSCVAAAFLKSENHGFFCFHFLTGRVKHALDVKAFVAFMYDQDAMPRYLVTCEDQTITGMSNTTLKLLPGSAFAMTEAICGHRPNYQRGVCGSRLYDPITVTVLKVLAPWKEDTRRVVLQVRYEEKLYALKMFVMRGHPIQLVDSPLVHEAKIYEKIQDEADLDMHVIEFHAFGYVFANDGLSTGPFCFSKPRTDAACSWVFTCFTMTEFVSNTLADFLVSSHKLILNPSQVQNLVRETLVTINACNQKKLQHNDVKLDNLFVCARDGRSLKDMDADEFETIEFTVKMGDLDLASYDHPLVGENPFYRYGTCQSTGIGAFFNPWSDMFKFLYYLSIYCSHLLPTQVWDQLIFVQPVSKDPFYCDLNQLQTKAGECTDLYVRYCNIITRGARSFTTLKDCNEHHAIMQKVMPTFQTLIMALK
jgi:serine/threonine protein kinase